MVFVEYKFEVSAPKTAMPSDLIRIDVTVHMTDPGWYGHGAWFQIEDADTGELLFKHDDVGYMFCDFHLYSVDLTAPPEEKEWHLVARLIETVDYDEVGTIPFTISVGAVAPTPPIPTWLLALLIGVPIIGGIIYWIAKRKWLPFNNKP